VAIAKVACDDSAAMWRTITLAVALAGCNLVFGLHDTAPGDGPHGPDAPPDGKWPRLVLMRQVLDGTTITTTWSASDPPPTTKVGPLGGALRDVQVADDGGFLVPADLLAAPYRIVYQLAGDAPTEIQWSGEIGTFTVPLFGRADRTPPPPGAKLHFTPAGAPATLYGVRVLTTGLWTSKLGLGTQPNPFDFTYGTANSLSGPLGALDGSRGDVEIVTAGTITDTTAAAGFGVAQVAALQPNASVTASSTWTTNMSPSIAVTYNETPLGQRLLGALGNLNGSQSTLHDAGALASSMMPTFTQPVPGALDVAAFLPLFETTGSTSPIVFADPFDGQHAPAPVLPLAVEGRVADSRTYMATVTLVSGFQEIATYGGLPLALSYDVGIAKDVVLGTTHLSGNMVTGDGVAVDSAGASTLPLVFATDMAVDDCVITVSSITAGGAVVPVYRYLVLQPPTPQAPVQIDRSLFQSGDYVLGIVCRRGSRNAMDYSEPQYPFITSTLQTAVFHVM
jgi:hypothetical protein